MTYYHGSKIGDIKCLTPNVSLHDEAYVYLTSNIVVATIYTVNAIERFFEDEQLEKPKHFQSWYSYGFNQEGLPRIEEYYPNAIQETYSGRSGYIYICKKPEKLLNPTNIYCAFVTDQHVEVIEEIFVEDVYEKLLAYERDGLLEIKNYEDNTSSYIEHIEELIKEDIKKYNLMSNKSHHYGVFLRAKFPHLFDK